MRVTSGPKLAVTFSFDGTGARTKNSAMICQLLRLFCMVRLGNDFLPTHVSHSFPNKDGEGIHFFFYSTFVYEFAADSHCEKWTVLHCSIFCVTVTFKAESGVYVFDGLQADKIVA